MSFRQLPPDSAYVTVHNGQLYKNGQRIKFWGAIGSLPSQQKTRKSDPYYAQRETVRRLKKVGFNLVRDWKNEADPSAKKGDLSGTDTHDFFIAECGRQGVHLWMPSILGGAIYESELPEKGKGDAWEEAVRGLCKEEWWSNGKKAVSLLLPAVVWDERLEAAALVKARAKAHHVNLHNGLRLADDPTVAVWELTNEQWWMSHMFGGDWLGLPAYFRDSLASRWCAFLSKKYGSEAALIRAWGFLFPGESLERKTVLLAPLADPRKAVELNDSNPAARAVFETIGGPVGREQCAPARASDVIAFFLELLIAHKTRCRAELKTWGKSCRLCPTVLDTGIGQSIQAQFMQLHGDAVAHASYMEGAQTGRFPKNHQRYPFYSALDNPPQLSNDVPWLEHNRPEGKPFFVYETQLGGPTKYRAEWPLLIAAAGSIQDWDAACWHYWSFSSYDLDSPIPYTAKGALSFPGSGAYQYHYTFDEVEQAALRAAGAILRHRHAAPAPHPTLFSWGQPALLDPRTMDYGGDYDGGKGIMDMLATAYAYGQRMAIDLAQKEFLKTRGPVIRKNGFEKPNPLCASPNITFDYHRSFVMFDAPGVASYTGFLSQYGSETIAFQSGVRLSAVRHQDPKGTPYPAGSERYTSFTLVSEDGKPLATCRSAVLVLVASSFNTGLKLTEKPDGSPEWRWGDGPILVTRVAATITAKVLAGMRYRMLDFNEKILAQGVVGKDGVLTIPSDLPLWLTELER